MMTCDHGKRARLLRKSSKQRRVEIEKRHLPLLSSLRPDSVAFHLQSLNVLRHQSARKPEKQYIIKCWNACSNLYACEPA